MLLGLLRLLKFLLLLIRLQPWVKGCCQKLHLRPFREGLVIWRKGKVNQSLNRCLATSIDAVILKAYSQLLENIGFNVLPVLLLIVLKELAKVTTDFLIIIARQNNLKAIKDILYLERRGLSLCD